MEKKVFELYKLAKRITNNQYDYDKANCNIINSKIIDSLKSEAREIELVACQQTNMTLEEGFLAFDKKVKMLIVNVFELTSNFLDESSILGLFLKENVEKITNNILLQNLKYIYVNKNNDYFYADNNVLFSKDQKLLIAYASLKEEEEYYVDSKVKEIANFAFFHASYLKRLYLSKKCKIDLNYVNKNIQIIYQ